jgi:NhaA family Na+:H+ antiporter
MGMARALARSHFNEPVTRHMHQDFTRLGAGLTVGQALDWLRRHPPPGRIIYFYVVDDDNRLQGVVPTRRLVLSAPETPLADIMVRKVVTLPAEATVLEACEFFIQHRLLAYPVVDDQHRLLGVVDVEFYTRELGRLSDATPIERWVQPLVRFLQIESAGGLVLLVCTAAALLLANSPWSAGFAAFWQTEVGLALGGFHLIQPLQHWINDGLMTVFFFVVGLEIKREIVAGELRDWRKAMLPVTAALGGMVVPAVIYLLFEWHGPEQAGWGISMATDIAFVVGFLALLGPRVPAGLKVMLLSLAIADDIGAVVVIAVAYTGHLSLAALAAAALGLGLVVFCRWVGVRSLLLYGLLGAGIWLAFLESGVHPTVAGVVLGLLTPARPWLGDPVPLDVVADLFRRLGGEPGPAGEARRGRPELVSPLERLESGLHPWVAFGIMPLFALANAGVAIEWGALANPVALAVAAGLVLGKPLGIFLWSWLSVRAGLTRLPEGVNARVLLGAGCLAGIGFTMSLFIAGLALHGPALEAAKVGILAGSAVSATLGFGLLWWWLPARAG